MWKEKLSASYSIANGNIGNIQLMKASANGNNVVCGMWYHVKARKANDININETD